MLLSPSSLFIPPILPPLHFQFSLSLSLSSGCFISTIVTYTHFFSVTLSRHQITPMAPSFYDPSVSTVCVMDASSHLGFNFVKRLLHRGFIVHASVQDHGEEQFRKLFADSNKLKVFRSDPFDCHSIINALKGCSGLFYNFEAPRDKPDYDGDGNGVSTLASDKAMYRWGSGMWREAAHEVRLSINCGVLKG